MQKTALSFGKTKTSKSTISAAVSTADLERHAQDWLYDGEYRQHSKETIALRRFLTSKLIWFLQKHQYEQCGVPELRQFLAYASNGHTDAGGRWGNPHKIRQVRPRTLFGYHNHLRTFFMWLVTEDILEESPMERVPAPIARPDQVQPFTTEQINSLIQSARSSQHPKRDEAIVRILLDTGIRASELCSLKMQDIDPAGRRCTILGKGNKRRAVYFGRKTARALAAYLRTHSWDSNYPVFASDRGTRAGEPLTRSGLLQLISRLGKAAGIQAARCSPHTFRHTFAVEFLRAGGNTFSLQQLLGHTTLEMTRRYSLLAQADIENQHRQFSPGDRF